jgi:hypothetical protein
LGTDELHDLQVHRTKLNLPHRFGVTNILSTIISRCLRFGGSSYVTSEFMKLANKKMAGTYRVVGGRQSEGQEGRMLLDTVHEDGLQVHSSTRSLLT